MENKIQIAADNMFNRGDITKTEHNELCKVAFNFSNVLKFGKKLSNIETLKSVLLPLALIGTGAAATKEIIIDPIVENVKINKSFNTMSKKVPQLAEADQNQVRDYFNVIKTFSPKSASNPLVAGALVNKMIQFGGVDHKLVQDISAIQAGIKPSTVAPTVIENVAKTIGASAIPSIKETSDFSESGNFKPTGVEIKR